ncbi:ArnT family glycosyltransferase [Sphingomonas sp. DT-207]|uniref:ArnT family glycosyltransferase n=1 Tax=Sphingomonas sp. DT-207 TaxID=3396167 RepID=UPI003F1C1CD8
MTEPPSPARNPIRDGWVERALVFLVLLIAVALRLHGVGFGLPALNDPDEPLFVMTAVEMLQNHSLNPGWFGHPATTTLYALVLVSLGVAGAGLATGHYADADAFVAAVYADPGLLFLPGRLFIVACGVACVWLTWLLGKRLGGPRLGLAASAFLAVNAVHIEYSQIIRTDVHASVFMLLCALSSVAILREGRLRDYLLAGLWAGLACATKWPAAVILLSPVCAAIWRASGDRREWRQVALVPAAGLAALLLASPYLVLDYATVVRNLAGEARPMHPGATGGSFVANLLWYLRGPLLASLGWAGLALAMLGLGLAPLRNRALAIAVLPGFIVFAITICVQALVWERWVVPLLPFLAITAGWSICWLVDRISRRPLLLVPAVLLACIPMVRTAQTSAVERANDTRQVASRWIEAHVPAGSTILIEHAAFDLLPGPWRLLFPLGSAGCIDVRRTLTGQLRYSQVETLRAGRPVIDLGHVDPALLETCRADYAVLSHYDVYRADAARFPAELGRYQRLFESGYPVAELHPIAGERGGPTVRIVRLR